MHGLSALLLASVAIAFAPAPGSGFFLRRLDGLCPKPIANLDIVGYDIGNKPSSTPEGCCDVCKQFPNCRAYSWTSTNHNGGTCWLKSDMVTTTVNGGVYSANVYEDNNEASCSAVEKDVDYIGNDVAKVSACDASECCPLCAKNDECHAWTWSDLNGGTCWLKSGKGQTAGKGGVKSAVLY